MHQRARRIAFAAAIVMAAGPLLALCVQSADEPSAQAPVPPAAAAPARAMSPAPRLPPEAPASLALDAAALARRPTALVARDRRAWRVAELFPAAARPGAVIRARTRDGRAYTFGESGRRVDDAIVALRATGELYVGWLIEGADPARPLADLEQPAERIEHVVELAVDAAPSAAPATLAIELDGAPLVTLTAASFADHPQIRITDPRGQPTSALDLERAFGPAVRLAGIDADGALRSPSPPAPGARPVVYLNRRGRFQLAWVDASNASLGPKQRELTRVALVRQP